MTRVSNPQRIIFPSAGITKADVVAFYERIAPMMLHHVAARLLTLERYPKGIGSAGFMQKNASGHFPDSIGRFEVGKQGGTTLFPVLHQESSIPYLANQGTITFHVGTGRVPDPFTPDRIVFDLDPPGADMEKARRACRVLGGMLEELGVPVTPVATGSSGYHLTSVIKPALPATEVAEFTRLVGALAERRFPNLLTIEFHKVNRGERVFVDWLRNVPGATTVAPWSLRPLPAAPVAVPLRWADVDDTLPDRWKLRSIDHVLEQPDPLQAVTPIDVSPAIASVRAVSQAEGIELEPFNRFKG